MATLSKKQIKEILDKRPQGTTPEGIVAALVKSGHKLEGYGKKNFLQQVYEGTKLPALGASFIGAAEGVKGLVKGGFQYLTGNKKGAEQTLRETEKKATQPRDVLGLGAVGVPQTPKEIISTGLGAGATLSGFAGAAPTALGRIGVGTASGAVYGAGEGVGRSEGKGGIETASNVVSGTAMGAATGAFVSGAFEGLGALLRKFSTGSFSGKVPIQYETKEVLKPELVKSRLSDIAMKVNRFETGEIGIKTDAAKAIAAIDPTNIKSPGQFFSLVEDKLDELGLRDSNILQESLRETAKDFELLISEGQNIFNTTKGIKAPARSELGAGQRLAGEIYTRELQPSKKFLEGQIARDIQTTGEKIAQLTDDQGRPIYQGSINTMRQQAQDEIDNWYNVVLNEVEQHPQGRVGREQIKQQVLTKLDDIWGAITPEQEKAIDKTLNRFLNQNNGLKQALEARQAIDKTIGEASKIWLGGAPDASFNKAVLYSARDALKTQIEQETTSDVIRLANQRIGLGINVRDWASGVIAAGQKGHKFSFSRLIDDILQNSIFSAPVTTRAAQGLQRLGTKTGETAIRQSIRNLLQQHLQRSMPK